MITRDDSRFQFWFRVYINDLGIAEQYALTPQCFPHIDTDELKWEMDVAWKHLEELIPEEHLQAIHDLL